jgi:hypothetical protein
MKRRVPFILFVAFGGFAVVVSATTYTVRPDGTGDFPTIQAAVTAATDGDVVELTNGTFTGVGNRDIDYLGKAITVRSQSGNTEACVIDCEGSPGAPHRGFRFGSSEDGRSVLEGLTITNGYDTYGGGGIKVTYAGPTLRRCILLRNRAGLGGGMLCEMLAHPVVSECTFAMNSAADGGGGLCLCDGAPALAGCTFFGNAAPTGAGICSPSGGDAATVEATIIAFSVGEAIGCGGSRRPPILVCCDIFGNAGGDWAGCIADQSGTNGNISADPLFCDPENGDFRLDRDSPCAPEENPDCGLIGAWPIGCGSTPVESTTWGALKALFQ